MAHLRDRASVDCSPGETLSRLQAHFASLRASDGVARLRLRVPIASADSAGLSLSREVRFEVQAARNGQNTILIRWEPEGKTVLPKFDGALVIRGDVSSDRSFIELDGTYVPPFDLAGQVFDDAIGHRIAQSTARELLNDLKRAVEARSNPI